MHQRIVVALALAVIYHRRIMVVAAAMVAAAVVPNHTMVPRSVVEVECIPENWCWLRHHPPPYQTDCDSSYTILLLWRWLF